MDKRPKRQTRKIAKKTLLETSTDRTTKVPGRNKNNTWTGWSFENIQQWIERDLTDPYNLYLKDTVGIDKKIDTNVDVQELRHQVKDQWCRRYLASDGKASSPTKLNMLNDKCRTSEHYRIAVTRADYKWEDHAQHVTRFIGRAMQPAFLSHLKDPPAGDSTVGAVIHPHESHDTVYRLLFHAFLYMRAGSDEEEREAKADKKKGEAGEEQESLQSPKRKDLPESDGSGGHVPKASRTS